MVRAVILTAAVLVALPASAQSGRVGGARAKGGVRTTGGRIRVTTGRRLGASPRSGLRPRSVRPTRGGHRVVVSTGRSQQPTRSVQTGRTPRLVVRQAHRSAPVQVTFATTHPCAPQTTYRVTPQTTYRVTPQTTYAVAPETTGRPPIPEVPPLSRPRPSGEAGEALGSRLAKALEAEDLEEACHLARWGEGDLRREQILRNALFVQLPSPTTLERLGQRLRAEPRWRGTLGRATLLRVISSDRE